MRFRQYRILVFVFLIIAVGLYRMPRGRQDEALHDAKTQVGTFSPKDESGDWEGKRKGPEGHEGQKMSRPPIPMTTATPEKSAVDVDRLARLAEVAKSVGAAAAKSKSKSAASAPWPVTSIASRPPIPAAKSTEPPTIPKQGIPNRNGTQVLLLSKPTAAVDRVMSGETPLPIIHWQKLKEHFPVESLIQLPTGTPKSIPKIQFDFPAETAEKKAKREARKLKVRAEFWHAWSGYKANAYMHDELLPLTGASNDPFCGWAATLIDGLDTLWIMGFEAEFEEAVKSVGTIDFTTNIRDDIPMFETTIRYLGGMLGAYDISRAKYKTLLDKSVELAEVLMGAFDTPNRMPLLYYHWKPAFASQPHRAETRANFAELGSMSLEFTRLAQLTGEAKYYDAIARITNALADWQKRGTKLPGVFPDVVDISGCNMTEQARLKKEKEAPDFALQDQSEPVGYTPLQPDLPARQKPDKGRVDSAPELKLEIIPGEVAKDHLEVVEKVKPAVNKLSKRRSPEHGPSPTTTTTTTTTTRDFEVPEFDCPAQGLAGYGFGDREGFSMGGGQDSSYEYFPKQWLLLGGLEDKYKTLHIKAMDAVRTYMLFRPMVPGNENILFSAKVFSYGNPQQEDNLDYAYEVTHLTCFIGGMMALGSKIFGIEQDLDIAKRLTDGCIWAYDSTPSGIMPEYSHAIPCESPTNCTWDEAKWWKTLDPHWASRDKEIQEYDENKKRLAKKQEEERLEAEKLEQQKLKDQEAAQLKAETEASKSVDGNEADVPEATTLGGKKVDVKIPARKASSGNSTVARDSSGSPAVAKRDTIEATYEKKLKATEQELNSTVEIDATTPRLPKLTENAASSQQPIALLRDPARPLSHEEYVKDRLERQRIPKGYSDVEFDKYILRPEAIESVWYMYRITGDEAYLEHGWRMFEAIIRATRSQFGHAAVVSVTTSKPVQIDSMESFWLAETLKYFYLLFETPNVLSLDDWVLNTEAHPFRRG